MFGDSPDGEIDDHAKDMKLHGLQQPIEILPNRTIITGHQRVRAAKKLGWAVIDDIVHPIDIRNMDDEALLAGLFVQQFDILPIG